MNWLLRTCRFAALAAAFLPLVSGTAQGQQPVAGGSEIEQLVAATGDARTVIFGEDSHGMLAIHERVPPLFERLVVEKGFRVFVFEAQWALPQGLADFMASDRTTLTPLDAYWLDGAFASQPIADMLVWIRTWNRTHPGDQIQIQGYQAEQPVADFHAIFAFLDKTAPDRMAKIKQDVAVCRAADDRFQNDLDFVGEVFKSIRAHKPLLSIGESKACLAAIARIAAYLKGTTRDAELARLHLFSLRSYYEVQRKLTDDGVRNPDLTLDASVASQGFAYGRGDAARFHIYETLQKLDFADKKVFHWMHNWHAARHASETDSPKDMVGIPKGTKSFGERLAAVEGAKLRTILTLVPCGTRCTEPAGSLEPAFAQRFDGHAAVVDLHKPADGLPIDKPGELYANHHKLGFDNVVLKRQADAVLYVPDSEVVH